MLGNGADKDGWTNAQLAIIDAAGNASPYSPKPVGPTWWQWIVDWWSGRTAEARVALEEKRDFFNKRLEVSGEQEQPKPSEEVWQTTKISPDDWKNPQVSWRIVARRDDSQAKPVSIDFTVNGNAGILEALAAPEPDATPESTPAETATRPTPTVKPVVAVPAQAIKPMAWEPTRDGAQITYQMPFDDSVRDYRFERMQRFFGPDPATGYARITYEGEPMPQGSAEILERKAATRDGAKYDEVTVRFSGLHSGTEVYWRAVPITAGSGDSMPSEILHFSTLPPPRIPWKSVALVACAAALLAVLWLRHKQTKVR